MHRSGTSRGALVVGALLIVLGAAALAIQVSGVTIGWPAWVILPGLAMLVAAFALPEPGGSGLAAVGGIVTAVGTVLAVQDATGTYASWAYAWALVAPGGVGVGLLLYGLLTRRGDIARGGAQFVKVDGHRRGGVDGDEFLREEGQITGPGRPHQSRQSPRLKRDFLSAATGSLLATSASASARQSRIACAAMSASPPL